MLYFCSFRIELNCLDIRGKQRRRREAAANAASAPDISSRQQTTSTTTTTKANHRRGKLLLASHDRSPSRQCIDRPALYSTSPSLYMAKNYQLVSKLTRYKPSSSLSSTETYAATCSTRRETVTVKITDLDQVNDFQLILVCDFFVKLLLQGAAK